MKRTLTSESSLSVEEDLPKAWERVIRQLEKSCDLDLTTVRDKSAEALVDEINPPKGTATDGEQTKRIFKHTLEAVGVCSALAFGAAGIVFGPSTQISNAISYVIQICQKTQDVFDSIVALMDKLRAFLEILSFHLDQRIPDEVLDKKLRRSVYRVLEQFVKIMAETHKLTKSWKGTMKIALHISVFAGYPSIKTAADKFDDLVIQVTNQQINQIYLKMNEVGRKACAVFDSVQTISVRTAQIQQDLDKLVLQEGEKQKRYEIRTALGIDTDKELQHIHAHEDNKALPGKGGWLSHSPKFNRWFKYRESGLFSHNVLEIVGPSGYGKSRLSHAIIERLQRESHSLKQQGVKTRVAWWYFRETPGRISLERAMHYVFWQLVRADTAYMKFLSTWTHDRFNGSDDANIFEQLLMGYSSKRPATTFFIVLDGIDHADSEHIETLRALIEAVFTCSRKASRIASPESLRVQLLLSGTPDTFDELHRLQGIVSQRIDLNRPQYPAPKQALPLRVGQQSDIEAFIKYRLDNSKVFHNNQHPELKQKVIQQLSVRARGNYVPLDQQLNAIAKYEDAKRVEKALNDIDGGNADFIQDEIETLNQGRSAPYIPQINFLLTWVSVAKSLDSSIMKSIISMRFDEAGLAEPAEYLRQHCSQLLNFYKHEHSKGMWISFKPEVEDRLRAAESARIKLDETEISMIKEMVEASFSRTFGEQSKIYERFEFEKFFNLKLSVHKALVHLVPDQGKNTLLVLETCLDVLCDPTFFRDDRPLWNYASRSFDWHFVQARDSIHTDSTKRHVGRRLYTMLTNDTLIEAWTSPNDRLWTMLKWLDEEDTTCESFMQLLLDPVVKKPIEQLSNKASLLYEGNTKLGPIHATLQFVVKHTLWQWYSGKYQRGMTILIWLRKYFIKATSQGAPFRTRSRHTSSAAEMTAWEGWARGELDDNIDNAQWHLRMANALYTFASINRGFRLRALRLIALERCDAALSADSRLWEATLLKATISKQMSRLEGSVELLSTLSEPDSKPQVHAPEYLTSYWETILPSMADCHMKLRQFTEARACYQRLLEHTLASHQYTDDIEYYACQLIRALRELHDIPAVLACMQVLNEKRWKSKSTLDCILQLYASHIHGHIIAIADNSVRMSEMLGLYSTAIEHAEHSHYKGFLHFLRLKLQWYCGDPDSREDIVREWELLVYSGDFSQWYSPYKLAVIKQLAQAYFTLSSEPTIDAEQKQEYIQRLETLDQNARQLIDNYLLSPTTLLYARIRHVNNDIGKAKALLRASVRKAIQLIREDASSKDGYAMLARILLLLDDKVNADAAWSLLGPSERESYEGFDDEMRPLSTLTKLDMTPDLEAGDSAVQSPIETVENGIESDNRVDCISELDLEDVVHMVCDGRCGHRWKYADEIWLCKDCFDVQLDSHCYQKLQAGTLDADVCNRNHQHFAVPAFDVKSWRELHKDMVVVDGKLVDRTAWLNGLEKEWYLDRWNFVLREGH